jgi:hypothetical protein
MIGYRCAVDGSPANHAVGGTGGGESKMMAVTGHPAREVSVREELMASEMGSGGRERPARTTWEDAGSSSQTQLCLECSIILAFCVIFAR